MDAETTDRLMAWAIEAQLEGAPIFNSELKLAHDFVLGITLDRYASFSFAFVVLILHLIYPWEAPTVYSLPVDFDLNMLSIPYAAQHDFIIIMHENYYRGI